MNFDESSTLSETFEEDELSVLNSLPHDQEGLARLLDHLQSFDSIQAWCYLFEEFLPILTEEQYEDLKAKAKLVWDEDGLAAMLPHLFPLAEGDTT